MQLQKLQDSIQTMVGSIERRWIVQTRAENFIAGGNWNELLGALFQASQSPDAGQRERAFRIFATTPGIIETQHEGVVQEVFGKGFKDSNLDVWSNSDFRLDHLLTIQ